MKLSFISSIADTTPTTTIIIPFNPEDEKSVKLVQEQYPVHGFETIKNFVGKSDGKSQLIFHEIDGQPVTLLFSNCHMRNQSQLNQHILSTCYSHRMALHGHVVIDQRAAVNKDADKLFETYTRSLCLSQHEVGRYKSNKKPNEKSIDQVSVLSNVLTESEVEEIFNRAKASADTIMSCMELVDAPANHKRPQVLADWMEKSGKENNFSVNTINKKELAEQGFHALLAVNRGSEDPACCIVAEYKGANSENSPTIALVGKGVTFDTGGMSIKPSNNMHYMKSDMGGAAAVMGTMELVAKLKLPVHVITVVPSTDNSVDSLAVKPGDVIGSYEGSTIEIIDTDAEGRLILADGLAYAIKNYDPEYIVDLATLTGSVVRTLGSHAAGLMTKNDDLAEALTAAGESSGDRVWRLPLWEEYEDYMQSDVADIRNLSTKPIGGAITAAKFLEHFTSKHEKWAHLDIAGTAFGASPYSKGYSASGFGILLLLQWIENIK